MQSLSEIVNIINSFFLFDTSSITTITIQPIKHLAVLSILHTWLPRNSSRLRSSFVLVITRFSEAFHCSEARVVEWLIMMLGVRPSRPGWDFELCERDGEVAMKKNNRMNEGRIHWSKWITMLSLQLCTFSLIQKGSHARVSLFWGLSFFMWTLLQDLSEKPCCPMEQKKLPFHKVSCYKALDLY